MRYSKGAANLFDGPKEILGQFSDAERGAIQRFLVEVEKAFDRVPD